MSAVSDRRREVIILGSTGSIGTQAIDVITRNPERFRVRALAAGDQHPELLAQQAAQLDASTVAAGSDQAADVVRRTLKDLHHGDVAVLAGPGAAAEVAGMPCDVVLNGITGAIGLEPTLAALQAGSTLALANKESLIIGGTLVTRAASPGQIVPVDSEHSALAQCLRAGADREVRRLVLTASGGPFRGRTAAELSDVTPRQALAHPTWQMGPVVTTNSATLVNKGLEVIEAHLLFGIPFARIDVVIHPQSMVHSMVEFVDGSTMAQISPPDMRLPIALGLSWPDRVPDVAPGCDWTTASSWEFLPLDLHAFPAVALARRVGAAGGTYPAVYNAANEIGVDAFLSEKISFTGIVDIVEQVIADHEMPAGDLTIGSVLAADGWARERAKTLLPSMARRSAGLFPGGVR